MGRAKVMTKKLPVAVAKDTVESIESNHVPVQRKRGRPRKVDKEEILAEKKIEERKALPIESADLQKKRKKPKTALELTDSGADSKGGESEEELKPKVGKRESSRRKSEPRRAAGACIDMF
ncbi:unnamed protein product [Calypogeia fissa]